MLISPPKPIREMFNSDEEYAKAVKDWNDESKSTASRNAIHDALFFMVILFGPILIFGATKVLIAVSMCALAYYVTYKAIKLVLTKLEGK